MVDHLGNKNERSGNGRWFSIHPASGDSSRETEAEAETVLKPAGQITWNRHCSSRIYEGDSASKG